MKRALAIICLIMVAGLNARTADVVAFQKRDLKSANVTELHDVEGLRTAFQRDAGKVRLIALLSPT